MNALRSLLIALLLVAIILPAAAVAGQKPAPPPGLQVQIDALAAQVSLLQATVATQAARITALETSSVMTLAPYLTVDTTTHRALFSGINLQLVNGAGTTNSINGLGNLIIGYDLARTDAEGPPMCSDGQYTTPETCVGIWAAELLVAPSA